MLNIDINCLQLLGLKPTLLQQWLTDYPGHQPWRIAAVDRGVCHLISCGGEDPSSPANHQQCSVPIPQHSSPAVGDWVILERPSADAPFQIIHSLSRNTWLRRGSVDGRSRPQEIAANLDTVFIVSAFAPTEKLTHRSVNPRKLERFIAAVAEGGSSPVVVLNKVDLCPEPDSVVSELARRLNGVPIACVSAQQGTGIASLSPWLLAGDTVAFVGSSGVGKSTLINRVLGTEQQATGAVRELDTKGKHTTTRRQLLVAPSGALLIDTPGLRELAVLGAEGESLGFDDINQLAEQCRFSDCQHETEPGCAVRAAIAAERLPADRLGNYRALQRDALRQRARHDALARHQQNKQFKEFTKMVRSTVKSKPNR